MSNKKQELDKLIAEAESHKIQELKKDNLRLLKQLEKKRTYTFSSDNIKRASALEFLPRIKIRLFDCIKKRLFV